MQKMQMRIKKRPSIPKVIKQKPMNMTFSTAMFPISEKQLKPITIKRIFRKPSAKLQPLSISSIPQQQIQTIQKSQYKKKQTQSTINESMMFQSYYQTMSKGWIKPSDYIQDIKGLNLLIDFDQQNQQTQVQIAQFQIRLNQQLQKNIQKIQALFKLTQKWVAILRRALFYVTSQRTNTDKLLQEVKFWKQLSKKFDQLQYEFNNQKTKKLCMLMRNTLKTKPQLKKVFQQFQKLKQQVIIKSISIKKIYLTLQQAVAGLIIKFEQSSCIVQSLQVNNQLFRFCLQLLQVLKRILLGFCNIAQSYPLVENRLQIVYRKMQLSLMKKLLAAPLYPRQLANISSLKHRYRLLDNSISFYSNFLSHLQQTQQSQYKYRQIIQKSQYTKQVISNLMEILCYFQFLYNKKDVKEFSKLFGFQFDYNIFDLQMKQEWTLYMQLVRNSMQIRAYQS